MARIRSIKPTFFTSLTVAGLTLEQRLTFVGLWTHVDDEGRCIADARLVKAAIWPLDDRTATDVADDLRALTEASLIAHYEVGGRGYIEVSGWAEHQRVNRPTPSAFPGLSDPGAKPLTCTYEPSVCNLGSGSEDSLCTHCRKGTGYRELGRERRTAPSTAVDTGAALPMPNSPPPPSGADLQPGSRPGAANGTDLDDGFEAFWAAWPMRHGKRRQKPAAQRSWRRLRPDERAAALVGARHYAAASATRLAGAKDAFRWLQAREWPDWQTPAVADRPATSPTADRAQRHADAYRRAAEEARRREERAS